jgi:hypothetical protein
LPVLEKKNALEHVKICYFIHVIQTSDKLLLLWRLRLDQTGIAGHDLELGDFLRHLLVPKHDVSEVESPDVVAVIVGAQTALLGDNEGEHHRSKCNRWMDGKLFTSCKYGFRSNLNECNVLKRLKNDMASNNSSTSK